MLGGLKLVVTRCDPRFVKWRRTNRNDRIARKWRKKFGSVTRCAGEAYQMGHSLYACACVQGAIRKVAGVTSHPGNTGVTSRADAPPPRPRS